MMQRIGLLCACVFFLVACGVPYYKNRLCEDVGWDFYHTMNICERAWYDWGMPYETALKWCSGGQLRPFPPTMQKGH